VTTTALAEMQSPCQLETPLGDELLLASCTAREALSTLGEAELSLRSEKKDIDPDDLLGKPVSLSIALGDEDARRHLHGYVTRFTQGGFEGRHFLYRMTVRPWLWLLTRTTDCRIFQDLSVPDIVKAVFQDHPVANFEFKLFRAYRKWNYCVQYRETDFNFVARLLEHEGIYWYVQHADGAHKLVLCDSSSAHDAAPHCASLPFYGNAGQLPPRLEYIREWSLSRGVKSGKVVITDYDFERPSTSLLTDQSRSRSYDLSDGEVFDYPGGYTQAGVGAQYAEDRLDEIQSGFEQFSASCNAQGVHAGSLLKMTRHPREDQNAQYLVTSTLLHLQQPVHESGGGEAKFDCRFNAIAASQQFRPPRNTPKPCVPGPQTAVVTGPAGEEIFTDKYGRVKVQFPWDRRGKKNEKSSCWISVSHPWAGASFGGMHVPRIGQEVIVGFLEGDPDRPIIIGRAYNAENMPPWELPANATQSGILTRSSKGAGYGNANAIRFEDKKGAEQLWLHAEKNQDIEVENDETHWVGHDRKKTIDRDETVLVKHDRTETVDHDETITIHHDRKERVDNDETISVGRDRSMDIQRDKFEKVARNKAIEVVANHTESIGSAMNIMVGSTLTETVAVNYAETVGGAMEITVGGAMAITVGAALAETVAGAKVENVGVSKSENIGGSRSLTVGGDATETIKKARIVEVAKDDKTTIGGQSKLSVTKEYVVNAKKIQVVGEEEIHFKVGSAEIVMKQNGDITVKGNKINIKGSGDVIIKGSKVLEN
jgi:type VI secretion system secreted protein VgrG